MRGNQRILLVDDDPVWLQTLADYLGQHGYEVQTAGDSESMLEQVRQQPIELILLDFHMPRLDGLNLLRRLHAQGVWVPVVLLSSDGDPHLPARALAAGAQAFLTKTASPGLLLNTVRRAARTSMAERLLPVPISGRRFLPALAAGRQ